MAELLIVIRAGMATEEGVKWIGASDAHDAILRLLDRHLAGHVEGSKIDELGDSIMALLMELPKAVTDG
jgi:hypothetical protein